MAYHRCPFKRYGGSVWESNPPKALSALPNGFEVPLFVSKLLNKYTVTELAKLSNLSKSYISQVKHGKCLPSQKLLLAIREHYGKANKSNGLSAHKAIDMFLESRREGLSSRTIEFYSCYLTKAIFVLGLNPKPNKISTFLSCLNCSEGGKHACVRAIRAFYRWLYSPRSGFNFRLDQNPIAWIDSPKTPKLILPSLSKEEVELLIEKARSVRDKAIISLFAESGLRLSELLNIRLKNIDWNTHTIRVLGKGNKEGYAPFGSLTELYLKSCLVDEFKLKANKLIWNVSTWGITEMLNCLRQETGLPCNPHKFRRTFASILAKRG